MTAQVEAAQAQMRVIYRSGSVGAAVAGVVWLASALTTVFAGVGWGIVVMVGVGFAIYPLTQAALRMLGGPASVPRDNPLRELAVEVPLVGPLMIPLVGAATLYRAEWFYPAFMLAMGGHYLPFSFLYGMRAFVVLGAVMSIGGLVIAVWASGLAVYEVVFITRQDLTPNEVDGIADKFKKIVEEQKGKLVSKEYWGLRTLAYKIKKNLRGHYVLMNIESDYAPIAEIERLMGFDENILRKAIFKVEGFSGEPSELMVSSDAKDYKTGKAEIVRKKQKEKEPIIVIDDIQ
jgi:ribosomal protein S6